MHPAGMATSMQRRPQLGRRGRAYQQLRGGGPSYKEGTTEGGHHVVATKWQGRTTNASSAVSKVTMWSTI